MTPEHARHLARFDAARARIAASVRVITEACEAKADAALEARGAPDGASVLLAAGDGGADERIIVINHKSRQRFWSKVDKRGLDDCWVWLAHKDKSGYGTIRIDSKPFRASHIALLLDDRPRKDNELALHHCDNPPCVNPSHLRWGSFADNGHDAIKRDRTARGERHGASKISEEDALQIRNSVEPILILAERYGVTFQTISKVKRKITWKYLPDNSLREWSRREVE